MIFKTRPNIKKQFDTIADLGIDNLIVSGCSFTHNNYNSSAVKWPYFLKDLGGFKQVLDCSLPGAGNQHISNSLLWALNIDQPDPKNSLIVVVRQLVVRLGSDFLFCNSNQFLLLDFLTIQR